MAVTLDSTYVARASASGLTAPSLKGLSSELNALAGAKIHTSPSETSPYYGTIIYDKTNDVYLVNGISEKYGMGGILASDGLQLKLTDNNYKKLISATNKVPTEADLINYNRWIREQYQFSTGNQDLSKDIKRNNVVVPLEYMSSLKPNMRQIGQVVINSNYELEFAGPLDARLVTVSEKTLVDPAWWLTAHKRTVYFYTGMPVTVEETGQMFVYMGYNCFLRQNDLSAKYMLSMKFWKRVSFEIDDIKNSGIIIPSMKVPVSVQTHRISAWSDTGGMFMSTKGDSSAGIGLTMADHMAMIGVSLSPSKTSYSRTLLDAYRRVDMFTGLTIIPKLVNEDYESNSYKSNADGVELSGINVPVWLRSTRYNLEKNSIEPNQSSSIVLRDGNIDINGAERITLNSPIVELTENTKFNILGSYKNVVDTNYGIEADGTISSSCGNYVLTSKNGGYISCGDELNIVTGALAVHTTGYNKKLALSNAALLLEPVRYNFRHSLQYADHRYIDVYDGEDEIKAENENIKTGGGTTSSSEIQGGFSDADSSSNVSTADPSTPTKGITAYYPGLTMAKSSALITESLGVGTVAKGFSDSNNYSVAPLSQISAYGTQHTSNLRVSKDMLNQFALEVVPSSSDNTVALTLIDLSDTNNFVNAKELTYFTTSDYKKAVTDRFKNVASKDASYFTNLSSKVTILNLENQVWIDKDRATNNAIGLDSSLLRVDRGYMILGAGSKLNKEQVQSFVDLVNTGTATIETFGDTSIYSHYGQVKLGKDNFVRLSRDRKFIIDASGKNAYMEVSPQRTVICNTTGNANDKGYIALKSNKIRLWEEEYTFTKPSATEVYLCYDPEKNGDTTITNALSWKPIAATSHSVNMIELDKVYQLEYNTNESISKLSKKFYYCIGELIINQKYDFSKGDSKISLWFYISSYYWSGDIQLELAISRSQGKIIPDTTDMFKWTDAHTFNIDGVFNVKAKPTSNETYPGPIGCACYYDEVTAKTHLRFYTPHQTIQGTKTYPQLSWFVHNIEAFGDTAAIDWENNPSAEWFRDADGNKVMGLIMMNEFNGGTDGILFNKSHHISPVVPLDKITDNSLISWEEFSSKDVSCNISCSLTSPLQVAYLPNSQNPLGDRVIKESNELYNEYGEVKTHVLAFTYESGDPSAYRTYKWVDLKELSKQIGVVVAPSSSSNTSSITAKIKVDALQKMTNKTGRKSAKHYVLSYDYIHPTSNDNADPVSGVIDSSLATHISVYYDDSGDLHCTNIFSSSDERIKKDIEPLEIDKPLPELKSFTFKQNDAKSFGVIAQELESCGYPELVNTDESGYKRVNYPALYALYIKSLQNQINELRTEIMTLKH